MKWQTVEPFFFIGEASVCTRALCAPFVQVDCDKRQWPALEREAGQHAIRRRVMAAPSGIGLDVGC
jgi:hypothetical protein